MLYWNPFCYFGYCLTEPELIPEPVSPGFSLFASGPIVVEIKGIDSFVLSFRLDVLAALLICMMGSSVVSVLVTYCWMIPPRVKKVEAPAEDIFEPCDPNGNTELPFNDDDDAEGQSAPRGRSIMDFVTDGVSGYYEREEVIENSSSRNLSSRIPIVSKPNFFRSSVESIVEKTVSITKMMSPFPILEPKAKKSAADTSGAPRTHDFCILTLHQFPRGRSIPCMAPHGMKIESLLRLCGIPHTVTIYVYFLAQPI